MRHKDLIHATFESLQKNPPLCCARQMYSGSVAYKVPDLRIITKVQSSCRIITVSAVDSSLSRPSAFRTGRNDYKATNLGGA